MTRSARPVSQIRTEIRDATIRMKAAAVESPAWKAETRKISALQAEWVNATQPAEFGEMIAALG